MRALFGGLAILLGTISILLAARYGYKGADTVVDGVISAVVFGAIALCAFLFDAAAVRLWFMRHYLGSTVIGVIAAAALVVTFTNSLGAIAGRADTTQAERTATKDDAAADRTDLKRITAERAAMAAFTPADAETVSAARAAVASAERTRIAECGNGDPKQRGPNCRVRETEEQAKRDLLGAVLTNKALSDKAAKLDGQAASIRARPKDRPLVQNANPLGAALEQIVGGAAAVLTAWQQAIVAGVFELCLVGVMVIYELLGQAGQPVPLAAGAAATQASRKQAAGGAVAAVPPPRKTVASPRRAAKQDSVSDFVRESFFPAEGGHRMEMRSLVNTYRAWCAEKGFAPVDLDEFLERIERLCRKLGVDIEVGDDQRVYLLNVRLERSQTLVAPTAH